MPEDNVSGSNSPEDSASAPQSERRTCVLLTGPGGRIGPHLLPAFRERYDLRLLDRRPIEGEPDTIVADLSDIGVLEQAMTGVDVLVHLAATSDEAPFIEELVPNNVVGVYNIYEAARRAGVRRIVFASTVQTVGKAAPGTIHIEDSPRPNSLYGVTKVFGEVAGRWFHDTSGIEFIGVRIGWFQDYDSPHLRRKGGAGTIWLSPRDCADILMRAIDTPGIGYALVFATSKTTFERLSLDTARELLGFEPQDDAAAYLQTEE